MDSKRKNPSGPGSCSHDSKKQRQREGQTVGFEPNFEPKIELVQGDSEKDIDPLGLKKEDVGMKSNPRSNQITTNPPKQTKCEDDECKRVTNEPKGKVDPTPSSSLAPPKQPSPISGTITSRASPCNLEEPEAPSSSVSISQLLEHPFTSGFWKVRQQDGILTQPIPLPKGYDSRETWYERFGGYPWLCESDELERFFCWPCLLFGTPKNVWSVVSSPTLLWNSKIFQEALTDHLNTPEHQKSESLYMRKKIITNAVNVEMWKYLLQTVVTHRKNNPQMMFSAEYLSKIKAMMGYFFNTTLTPKSALILCEVILETVSRYIRTKITEGVRQARYIALHIEDLSPVIANETWLVTIARYADQDGRIHDRVIDFFTASSATIRTDWVAVNLMRHLFDDNRMNENVTGLSYSATLVVPKDILLLNNGLLKWCPRALFFHPPDHSLYKSLFQSLSHSGFCRTYLRDLESMRRFLRQPKVFEIAQSVAPIGAMLCDVKFPSIIKSQLKNLMAILKQVESSKQSLRREQNEAKKYLNFLSSSDSRFLMVVLELIWSSVQDIAKAIEGPWVEFQWFEDVSALNAHRDEAIKKLRQIARGIDEIDKDELMANAMSHCVSLKTRYNRYLTVIVGHAVELLMQRFENFDVFMCTRSDIIKSSVKSSRHILPLIHRQMNLSITEESQLDAFLKSHTLAQKGTHAEVLNWLTTENLHNQCLGLYKYLLLVHTIARGSAFGTLLKSVYSYIKNKPLSGLTMEYLDGYFFHDEDLPTILEDPDFVQMALTACRARIDQL